MRNASMHRRTVHLIMLLLVVLPRRLRGRGDRDGVDLTMTEPLMSHRFIDQFSGPHLHWSQLLRSVRTVC
jgi:hypothetical protein